MKHLPMDVQTPFTFCPRRQTLSDLHKTSTEDLAVTKDVCCVVQQDKFSQTFAELAHLILRENNLQIPSDLSQAEHFYIVLLGFIEDSVVLKLTSFIHEKGLSLSSCCVFSVLDWLKKVNSSIGNTLSWSCWIKSSFFSSSSRRSIPIDCCNDSSCFCNNCWRSSGVSRSEWPNHAKSALL